MPNEIEQTEKASLVQQLTDIQKRLDEIQGIDDEWVIPEEERGLKCDVHLFPISEENPKLGVVIFGKMAIDQHIPLDNGGIAVRQFYKMRIVDPDTDEISERTVSFDNFNMQLTKEETDKDKNSYSLSKTKLAALGISPQDLIFGRKNVYEVTRDIRTGRRRTKITKVPNNMNEFWPVRYRGKAYNIHYFSIN